MIGVGTPCHLIILHNIHIYFNVFFFQYCPDFCISDSYVGTKQIMYDHGNLGKLFCKIQMALCSLIWYEL